MEKKNIVPLLLLAGAAVAFVAFRGKGKKKGKVIVSDTEKISEDEFEEAAGDNIKEMELEPNPVTNPITEAAGGASSRISQLAEEATGTIEAVQTSVETAKAALEKPVSAIKLLAQKLKSRKKKAQAAVKKLQRAGILAPVPVSPLKAAKAAKAARKAKKVVKKKAMRMKKIARKRKLGLGEVTVI